MTRLQEFDFEIILDSWYVLKCSITAVYTTCSCNGLRCASVTHVLRTEHLRSADIIISIQLSLLTECTPRAAYNSAHKVLLHHARGNDAQRRAAVEEVQTAAYQYDIDLLQTNDC